MITHLACVMDGNRRWAKQQGQLPWLGHKAGIKTIEVAIQFCLQQKISYLSLYTFSLENFNRTQIEQSYMFDMMLAQAESQLKIFIDQNIKIKFIGNIARFPETIQNTCRNIEEKTAHGTALQINFLFGYGAQQEIFDAAQRLSQAALAGQIVTQELFESFLWTAGVPNPDLIIRTGGVQRLSNFLLYQSAYTEIRFLETLWPDLTDQEILETVTSAVQAQKNSGK